MRAEIENGNIKIHNKGKHHSGRPAVLESQPRQYLGTSRNLDSRKCPVANIFKFCSESLASMNH
jgi:hypothetical protein